MDADQEVTPWDLDVNPNARHRDIVIHSLSATCWIIRRGWKMSRNYDIQSIVTDAEKSSVTDADMKTVTAAGKRILTDANKTVVIVVMD